jgi:hypothetical protein
MQRLRDEPHTNVVEEAPRPPDAGGLPDSDGMPMESERHVAQMYLLGLPLKHYMRERRDVYVGMNMFVYISADCRFD